MDDGYYDPWLSSLMDLLGSAFPLRCSKTQMLLDQRLGMEISRREIVTIRQRIGAAFARAMA